MPSDGSGKTPRPSRAGLIALHVVVAGVFVVFAILYWAHADRKWHFSAGLVDRNSDIATYILAIFVSAVGAVFVSNRHTLRVHDDPSSFLQSVLSGMYLALLVVLVASAPQILTFRSEDHPARHDLTRQVLRHTQYGARFKTIAAVQNIFSTSHIRALAYFGAGATVPYVPGLVGNILHDVALQTPSNPIPAGVFNASATQFSVSCAAPDNARASVTDSPVGLDSTNGPYSNVKVSMDVPGRGSVELEDMVYRGGNKVPFGFPFRKAASARVSPDYDYPTGPDNRYVRFPRAFNPASPPQAPDTTIYGVQYDRTAERSGIDDELGNTIFFYVFRKLIGDFGPLFSNLEAYTAILDPSGNAGSTVDIAAEGSVLDGPGVLTAQAVACTMTAKTFNTTVSHADGLPDLSHAPTALASRSERRSSWAAFQPRPASSNQFERSWANIFTPFSSPPATPRTDNSSAVPGFVPLTTLESYMTSILVVSPKLATLESALENITALAYWGLMQEYADMKYLGAPNLQPVGVVHLKDAQVYVCLGSSVGLLLLSIVIGFRRRA